MQGFRVKAVNLLSQYVNNNPSAKVCESYACYETKWLIFTVKEKGALFMVTKHFGVWSIGHGQLLDFKLLRELAAATIGEKLD